MRLPGLGPKTAARIWRELGVTTLAELKAAAEGERLRTLAGIGGGTEAKILKALAEGQGRDEPRARPARGRPARRARGRRDTACAPRRGRRVRSGQHAPPSRDVPRSRRDRDSDRSCGADGPLRRAALGARGRRPRRHQGNGDHASRASASTSASCRPRATAICSSTSRARRSTTSPCASRPSAAGSRSPSTASRSSRRARCTRSATRSRSTPSSATASSRPSCARTAASSRRRGTGAAAARRARRPARRDALPFDLVGGRQGDDRGDGARPPRRAATSSSASPTTRTTCGTEGSRRSGARSRRSTSASTPFRVLRGIEANITAKGEVDVADDVLAELDWVVASLHTSLDRSPTERVLAAMDNPHVDCIGHLTGRRISRRPGAELDLDRVVGARSSRPARRSRSTASPTGSTCAMRTRAWPARPAWRSRSTPMRIRSRRSAMPSSGSARRGGVG